MVDSYTPSLRIIQMPTGSNTGAWGPKADAGYAMLEKAIAGAIDIDLSGGDHTLTTANNADDEARNAAISFTGTPGATTTVTVPDVTKLTLFINDCDSTVILTTGSGASAALEPGQVGFCLSDGATNIYAFVIADLAGKGVLPQVFAHESL